MTVKELKETICRGGLEKYSRLYENTEEQKKRFLFALDRFAERHGEDREAAIFSVPGRTEIIGNHTDHNRGRVMAGAINRDIIAVAAKNDVGAIRMFSEGFSEDCIRLSDTDNPDNFKRFTSRALVAGMVNGFVKEGLSVGGFDFYSTTEVLKGSGLSSSAAFEVMIGNILNHLYNRGEVDNKLIARLAQYSENVYFGKPCGLMDQMACAVGGFVYIDFENPECPEVQPIDFSLSDVGYALCIVNTGGSHANLNDDYAAVPAEMKAVASALGKEVLRGVDEPALLAAIPTLRERVGDRAILRALHFIRENDRVTDARAALLGGDITAFLSAVSASGSSSFRYLQNVFTCAHPEEQGISLALAVSEGILKGTGSAVRVHGGGFAGTAQIFLPIGEMGRYVKEINAVFGEGAAMPLNIRPAGAVRLF